METTVRDYRLNLDLIQWHEGMPLTPQHFQLNDMRVQQALRLQNVYSNAYQWGIIKLSIDQIALQDGIFRVNELFCILRDGSFVSYRPQSTVPLLEIDLTQTAAVDRAYIYIAVPKLVQNEPSISGNYPRYLSQPGDMVLDENGNVVEPVRIPRLATNIYIVSDTQPSDRFESLPIAEIEMRSGRFELSDYVPPCLALSKDSRAYVLLEEVVSSFRSCIEYASSRYSAFEDSLANEELKNILSVLIGCSISLESCLGLSLELKPVETYQAFIEIASRISVLRLRQDVFVPKFAKYDHYSILSTFEAVAMYIKDTVEGLFNRMQVKQFQKKGAYFGMHIPLSWKRKSCLLGLQWNGKIDPLAARDWMRNAIISTEGHVRRAIEGRLVGADRQFADHHDFENLQLPKDNFLLEVSLSSPFVDLGEVLYVFNPSDTESSRPDRVFLYVRGEDL